MNLVNGADLVELSDWMNGINCATAVTWVNEVNLVNWVNGVIVVNWEGG